MTSVLTPTDLFASATRLLEAGGYGQVREGVSDWGTASTRLFEDPYGVVGLAVFATCAELLESWPALQGSLVDVISRKIGSSESKAWDGYLVLLTPGPAPTDGLQVEDIRYDTTRLRKLVATAEDLSTPGDVERLLRPLLPLHTERGAVTTRSALDLLPAVLAQHNIPREITDALLQAFVQHKALIEPIHNLPGNR